MAIFTGARQLPLHHITIRVPWHDNGWNGTVCNRPCNNTSCLNLSRIAENRKDDQEQINAGKSIDILELEEYPPCVAEHGTFMAKFDVQTTKHHPYQKSSSTHEHFADTPFTFSAHAAAAVPYRWMLKKQVEGDFKEGIIGKAESLRLNWEPEREPDMNFKTAWVQEGTNQRVMLDTFFGAVEPEDSLVFFYAKRTPLSEDVGRVIIGAGRVTSKANITEYQYQSGSRGEDLQCFLWERNIGHSIREGWEDGFLLPYQQLLDLAENDSTIDVEAHVAFAPEEFFEQYSYGSELLPHDGAIASLLECERVIKQFKKTMDGYAWDKALSWINKELNRLWEIRGPFPGFGSALRAFGVEHGTLLAWYIYEQLEKAGNLQKVNPWDTFTKLLNDPADLPNYLKQELGPTLADKWRGLAEPRRQLLDLLSRCAITEVQALRYYQLDDKTKAGIEVLDKEILSNPYLLFESDRAQIDAIQYGAIDRGVFPEDGVREHFPLPEPSAVNESIDLRRVRALCTDVLTTATAEGHTLLPNTWLVSRIREKSLQPSCQVDEDVMGLLQDHLSPTLVAAELSSGEGALQLAELAATKRIITNSVIKRHNSRKSNLGDFPWPELVQEAIGQDLPADDVERHVEQRARLEKSAALEQLFRSRVSVLVGSAGTGKSTLLKALCNIQDVRDNGLLLLAPTGKARVRLEQATGLAKQGLTIAQFLLRYGRYDGTTGRYLFDSTSDACSSYKTVVIDECSMLTEDQLAALIDGLKNVSRFILVGDPQQLPPIGAGRPFVDIVRLL
ncbi:MAG: RNA helicase, partial [Gammaproteobacteria bacterium]